MRKTLRYEIARSKLGKYALIVIARGRYLGAGRVVGVVDGFVTAVACTGDNPSGELVGESEHGVGITRFAFYLITTKILLVPSLADDGRVRCEGWL